MANSFLMWKLRRHDDQQGRQWSELGTASVRVLPTLEPNSFIVVTSQPLPLNQANFFNCTVSAEQPVPAVGGGD
jgi:hypothetical protein